MISEDTEIYYLKFAIVSRDKKKIWTIYYERKRFHEREKKLPQNI